MIATANHVLKELQQHSNPQKASGLSRFFKTGPGEYGEGDRFLGITVPVQREVATIYRELPLTEIQKLLQSKTHEHRFTALEILVLQYEKGSSKIQKDIYNFYIRNTQYINNWDLVDTSVEYIVGPHLREKSKVLLYTWIKSKNMWERRMALVATFEFIRHDEFSDTLQLATLVLQDKHDLIHKASGWMLREVGKRDKQVLIRFLNEHASTMPRTMLRYAIEHFPAEERQKYLKK